MTMNVAGSHPRSMVPRLLPLFAAGAILVTLVLGVALARLSMLRPSWDGGMAYGPPFGPMMVVDGDQVTGFREFGASRIDFEKGSAASQRSLSELDPACPASPAEPTSPRLLSSTALGFLDSRIEAIAYRHGTLAIASFSPAQSQGTLQILRPGGHAPVANLPELIRGRMLGLRADGDGFSAFVLSQGEFLHVTFDDCGRIRARAKVAYHGKLPAPDMPAAPDSTKANGVVAQGHATKQLGTIGPGAPDVMNIPYSPGHGGPMREWVANPWARALEHVDAIVYVDDVPVLRLIDPKSADTPAMVRFVDFKGRPRSLPARAWNAQSIHRHLPAAPWLDERGQVQAYTGGAEPVFRIVADGALQPVHYTVTRPGEDQFQITTDWDGRRLVLTETPRRVRAAAEGHSASTVIRDPITSRDAMSILLNLPPGTGPIDPDGVGPGPWFWPVALNDGWLLLDSNGGRLVRLDHEGRRLYVPPLEARLIPEYVEPRFLPFWSWLLPAFPILLLLSMAFGAGLLLRLRARVFRPVHDEAEGNEGVFFGTLRLPSGMLVWSGAGGIIALPPESVLERGANRVQLTRGVRVLGRRRGLPFVDGVKVFVVGGLVRDTAGTPYRDGGFACLSPAGGHYYLGYGDADAFRAAVLDAYGRTLVFLLAICTLLGGALAIRFGMAAMSV